MKGLLSVRSLVGMLIDAATIAMIMVLIKEGGPVGVGIAAAIAVFFLLSQVGVALALRNNLKAGGTPTELVVKLTAEKFSSHKGVVLFLVMTVASLWAGSNFVALLFLVTAAANLSHIGTLAKINSKIADDILANIVRTNGWAHLPPEQRATMIVDTLRGMDPADAVGTIKAALHSQYGERMDPRIKESSPPASVISRALGRKDRNDE